MLDISKRNYITCTFDWLNLKAYLNWELETTTIIGWTVYKWNGNTFFWWGWAGWTATLRSYYDWDLDEVRIYNKALTSNEIKILYNIVNQN